MNFFKRLVRSKIEQVKDWQDPNREDNPTACPEITIEQISPEVHAKLLAEATTAGATFEGSFAYIEGLSFDWNYDSTAQVLHVTCLKKPFYAACGEVESKIRELVEKAKVALP